MKDHPTKSLALVERRVMQHLGPTVYREIWVDSDDVIWWRLVNGDHESEYFKGDPR